MIRRLFICAAVAAGVTFAQPASAGEPTFATTLVTAGTPRGAAGFDAGVDVGAGAYVRLTAGGTIALSGYGACPRRVGPNGCSAALSPVRVAAAPTGALLIAFATRAGTPVTSWTALQSGGYAAVPRGAARLLLRINGTSGREQGAFRVVADVVPTVVGAARAPAAAPATGGSLRRTLPTMRAGVGRLPARADVQHLLRRFGFSDTPAAVSAVYRSGSAAWLAQQLAPASIDDSALSAYVEPIPLAGTSPQTMNGYDDYRNVLERRILQREIASKRQLLEKMTLHWLQHFAVSEDKVGSAPAMIHYEETLRTDALGNFKQLVADVTVEPAMLLWLDNNNNDGSNVQKSPPNENFGRELMQLYVLGTTQLNPDGTPVLDAQGGEAQTYSDADVKQVAQALTGFQRQEPYPLPAADPRTLDTTRFYPTRHAKGPFTILGQTVTDTGDPTIVAKVVGVLAANPSTAPFEVKELLQRFVTETPSPGYVQRIVQVWNANADAPDQLARVMGAIAGDPEFYSAGEHALVKEPIGFTVDAVRALNGSTATPFGASMRTPYNSLRGALGAMQEAPWYPPSVFSFYRPGDKASLLSNALLLTRWGEAASLSNTARTKSLCATCDVNLDLTNLTALAGGTTPAALAAYLLDALADGGTPELQALLENYLASGTAPNLNGALWLVLTSPEYEVD